MQNLQIIFTWHSYGIDMKNLVRAKTCPGGQFLWTTGTIIGPPVGGLLLVWQNM